MPRIYTYENLVGQKFHRLTVIALHHLEPRSKRFWTCKCDCGTEHVVNGSSLREGSVKSCGCLNRESAAKNGALYGPLNRGPREDWVGRRFGRLVVESYCSNEDGETGTRWVCVCDCGNRNIVKAEALKTGMTRSCGCLRDEVKRKETIARNTTHGLANIPEYSNWKSIINRCFNPKDIAYPAYGAVGKIACEFIRYSPANLIILLGKKPTLKHEVDRIKNELGYYCGSCAQCVEKGWPLNIRWATRIQQMRNRTTNSMFTIDGETHCASEWAEKLGLTWPQFAYRYRHCKVKHATPNLS